MSGSLRRVALVIGNSKYINVRALPNPAGDTAAVAELFRAAGFDVVDASNNLRGTEMRRAFRDFAEKSRGAAVPGSDHAVEVLAHDRVVGGLDDRRQTRPGHLGPRHVIDGLGQLPGPFGDHSFQLGRTLQRHENWPGAAQGPHRPPGG